MLLKPTPRRHDLNEININLNEYLSTEETALVGRDNGRNLRKTLNAKSGRLEDLEKNYKKIYIIIPNQIVSMNRSFFLGAFADRARSLGKVNFREKYQFGTSNHINNKIEDHIDYAIKTATAEEILDV